MGWIVSRIPLNTPSLGGTLAGLGGAPPMARLVTHGSQLPYFSCGE